MIRVACDKCSRVASVKSSRIAGDMGSWVAYGKNSWVYTIIFQWSGLMYILNIWFFCASCGLMMMGQFSRYHYDVNRVKKMIVPIGSNLVLLYILLNYVFVEKTVRFLKNGYFFPVLKKIYQNLAKFTAISILYFIES